MRLLADENVHGKVVRGLRDRGFEVEWIHHSSPGALDPAILARADISDWVLITCDRDFGDLILHHELPAPLAVLYTRIEHRDWQATLARLREVIIGGVTPKAITTITRTAARVRSYAAGVGNV